MLLPLVLFRGQEELSTTQRIKTHKTHQAEQLQESNYRLVNTQSDQRGKTRMSSQVHSREEIMTGELRYLILFSILTEVFVQKYVISHSRLLPKTIHPLAEGSASGS